MDYQPFCPQTTGDGFHGQVLKNLCYVGNYCSFSMYLTRRLVDHRLTDEERRTVTDVEEYISSRNMVLDIRDILVRHLNNEKVQPNFHVMVPTYSISFAAGICK